MTGGAAVWQPPRQFTTEYQTARGGRGVAGDRRFILNCLNWFPFNAATPLVFRGPPLTAAQQTKVPPMHKSTTRRLHNAPGRAVEVG